MQGFEFTWDITAKHAIDIIAEAGASHIAERIDSIGRHNINDMDGLGFMYSTDDPEDHSCGFCLDMQYAIQSVETFADGLRDLFPSAAAPKSWACIRAAMVGALLCYAFGQEENPSNPFYDNATEKWREHLACRAEHRGEDR